MSDAISVYGLNGSGGRNVSVTLDGVSAVINSSGPEHDAAALALAEAVANAAAAVECAERREADLTNRIESMRAANARLQIARDEAFAALKAAAEGRRRFFGPVLCVPVTAGDWSGPVWLLDPNKAERGHGLRFASLAEVRALHPELWVVDVTERGVLLDAVKLPVPA